MATALNGGIKSVLKGSNTYALIGTIIHSVDFGKLEVIDKGVLVYSEKGVIDRVIDVSKNPIDQSVLDGFKKVYDFTGKLIIPGLIDAHCHAPQYVFTGTGMDLTLLKWLETYTFPCESRFKDTEFAKKAYEASVRRHLKCGTTFAAYFATIHNEASKVLVEVINTVGQRAYVGKVSMDRNSPDFYIEETAAGCDDAEGFVRYVLSQSEKGAEFLKAVETAQDDGDVTAKKQKTAIEFPLLNSVDSPLVLPAITPRFVPTCTPSMMQRLGDISKKYGLPVQSHMSESPGEIAWVKELHPDCVTYADVYEKYGLLHENAVMAHCCHSDPIERGIMKRTGTGAVHCASSNFMLSSGVMDVRLFIEEGIKVAVGTDVAGGYSPSMLDALRQTIIASRVKGFNQNQNIPASNDKKEGDVEVPSPTDTGAYASLNYLEAFHLCTVGGAEVLGMGEVVGNFLPGKKLDCLVIDVSAENTPIDLLNDENAESQFEKFLFLGDDRNIESVFVNGRKVI